jgi:hypothetical protein
MVMQSNQGTNYAPHKPCAAQTMRRMLHENRVLVTPRHHGCPSPTGVNGY